MTEFKLLDPACGSGNFLYIAYREMKRLETELIIKIQEKYSVGVASRSRNRLPANFDQLSLIQTKQFYGIDIKPFAVELAKVTLMLGKKLAINEERDILDQAQLNIFIMNFSMNPLVN